MSDMIESTKSTAVPQHDSSQFTFWLHKNLFRKTRVGRESSTDSKEERTMNRLPIAAPHVLMFGLLQLFPLSFAAHC
jgi:hypothetical protein